MDWLPGLGNLFQQAQKMKEEVQQLQEGMGKKTIQSESGGGLVKVVVNGNQQILSLSIEPELLRKQDAAMIQDLVIAAVNQAMGQSRDLMTEELKKLAGGLAPLLSMLKGQP